MTNDEKCPDCGVEIGMPHHEDCDVLRWAKKYREVNDRWPLWSRDEETLRVHVQEILGDVAHLNITGGYADGGRVQVAGSNAEYRLVMCLKRLEGSGWQASERVLLPCSR